MRENCFKGCVSGKVSDAGDEGLWRAFLKDSMARQGGMPVWVQCGDMGTHISCFLVPTVAPGVPQWSLHIQDKERESDPEPPDPVPSLFCL